MLDLVLCNNDNLIDNLSVGEKLSDHKMIFFDIKFVCDKRTANKRLIPCFSKANFSVLEER